PMVVRHERVDMDDMTARVANGPGYRDVHPVDGPLDPLRLAVAQRSRPLDGIGATDDVPDRWPAPRGGPPIRDAPDLVADDARRGESADEQRIAGVVPEAHGLGPRHGRVEADRVALDVIPVRWAGQNLESAPGRCVE